MTSLLGLADPPTLVDFLERDLEVFRRCLPIKIPIGNLDLAFAISAVAGDFLGFAASYSSAKRGKPDRKHVSGSAEAIRMRTIAIALLACALPADSHAELLRCMPEQTYLFEEIGKWEKQYGGPLLSVTIGQSFGAGKSSTITCRRVSGEASLMVRDKACRIIPGKGKSVLVDSNEHSEIAECDFPPSTSEMSNDKTCMIDCN